MTETVRLNKYLAGCGVAARRKCDELISAGRVMVNGTVETRLGSRVTSADRVYLNNTLVVPEIKDRYILLNKPCGFVTTAADEKQRKTVFDLVSVKGRLFPVGRLDRDTSGLLLLTNDGDLAHRITHPRYEIRKCYEVTLGRALTEDGRLALQAGVALEEGITSPCRISWPNERHKEILRMTMHQGWNRQIRRMFSVLGYEVKRLRRAQIGSLSLTGLPSGKWRDLSNDEVVHLKKEVYGNQR